MGGQGTILQWHKEHLRALHEPERAGVEHVEWETASDEHVCPRCRARNGRVHTIEGMRKVTADSGLVAC